MDKVKIARRLFFAAAVLLMISVAAFVLKGPSTYKPRSAKDLMELLPGGGISMNAPILFTLCGDSLFLAEPSGDSIKLYAGPEIAKRMQEGPGTPFLKNDIARSFPDLIVCDTLHDETGEVDPLWIPEEPEYIDEIPIGPAPPGHKWSA